MESSSDIVMNSIGFCGGGEGWMSGIVITSIDVIVIDVIVITSIDESLVDEDLYFLLLLFGNLIEMVGTVV